MGYVCNIENGILSWNLGTLKKLQNKNQKKKYMTEWNSFWIGFIANYFNTVFLLLMKNFLFKIEAPIYFLKNTIIV